MFQIDENVLLFLNGHLGNNDSNAFIRCSNFAYRDMCRTITYAVEYNENHATSSKEKGVIAQKKRNLRDEITKLIETKVKTWIINTNLTKNQFNADHESLCRAIIEKYKGTTHQNEPDNSLYFGQAQKWVNMTLKNLYVYSKSNNTSLSFDNIIEFFHVPIDNVILDIASGIKRCYIDPPETKYGVAKPEKAWSKWNYNDYKEYQEKLEASIKNDCPIIWELKHWSTVED
jgi:hypothetical protein